MSLSKEINSPFQMEWRRCLVEHFKHLASQEEYVTMISFYTMLSRYNLKKVVKIANTGYTIKELESGVLNRDSHEAKLKEEAKEAKRLRQREKSKAKREAKKAEKVEDGKPKDVWLFS